MVSPLVILKFHSSDIHYELNGQETKRSGTLKYSTKMGLLKTCSSLILRALPDFGAPERQNKYHPADPMDFLFRTMNQNADSIQLVRALPGEWTP